MDGADASLASERRQHADSEADVSDSSTASTRQPSADNHSAALTTVEHVSPDAASPAEHERIPSTAASAALSPSSLPSPTSTDSQPSGDCTADLIHKPFSASAASADAPSSTPKSAARPHKEETEPVMMAPSSLYDVDDDDADDASASASTFFLTGIHDVSLPSSAPRTIRVDPTPDPIPTTPSDPPLSTIPPTPPTPFSIDAIPRSTLVSSLSLSALNCLLDFKRRPRHPPSSSPSSSSSLSAALRALAHTLAHPLAPPSLPSHLAVYQLPTISSTSRPRPTHPHPPHPSPPLLPSSPHPQWDAVRAQVQRVQADVSRMGRVWGLDEVSAGLMGGGVGGEGGEGGGEGVRRVGVGEGGEGGVVGGVRGVRKVRVDYVSAAHVKEVGRAMRRRRKEREQQELHELVRAVNSATQHTQQQARA